MREWRSYQWIQGADWIIYDNLKKTEGEAGLVLKGDSIKRIKNQKASEWELKNREVEGGAGRETRLDD